MTTQQKIRNVRRRLHELMRLREKTVLVNPNDPTEKECARLATVLCEHEQKWKAEKAAIDKQTNKKPQEPNEQNEEMFFTLECGRAQPRSYRPL